MANIRALKDTVNRITFEVISDCFGYQKSHPGESRDEVMKIITSALENRNKLISRINHPEGEPGSTAYKKQFNEIRQDLLAGTDDLFKTLSKLASKKKA